MPPRSEQPLQVWERWLYGGLGSLAPIAVAMVSVDVSTMSQMFRGVDPVLAAGWIARTAVLAIIGGFVAFLHKKETDAWRCFVIGIAAPALITTAISGKQLGRTASLPSYVTAAFASEAPAIATIPISALKETSSSKFERGFLGVDPPRTYVVISQDLDQKRAMDLASAVYRFSQCALRDPRNVQFRKFDELNDLAPPILVTFQDALAILAVFNEQRAANAFVTMLRRTKLSKLLPLDSISTSRAKAQADLETNLFFALTPGDGDGYTDAQLAQFIRDWTKFAQTECTQFP
jgi:hypothetical protein